MRRLFELSHLSIKGRSRPPTSASSRGDGAIPCGVPFNRIVQACSMEAEARRCAILVPEMILLLSLKAKDSHPTVERPLTRGIQMVAEACESRTHQSQRS